MVLLLLFIGWTLFFFIFIDKDNIKDDTNYRLLCESSLERKVYDALLQKGYHPKTQVKVGRYRIDVALTEYRIAIECDGEYWHSSPEALKRDARKNHVLEANGWKVCRFRGKVIEKDIGHVLYTVEKKIGQTL